MWIWFFVEFRQIFSFFITYLVTVVFSLYLAKTMRKKLKRLNKRTWSGLVLNLRKTKILDCFANTFLMLHILMSWFLSPKKCNFLDFHRKKAGKTLKPNNLMNVHPLIKNLEEDKYLLTCNPN